MGDSPDLRQKFSSLFDALGLDGDERAEKLRTIEEDLDEPVKLIGIGQTGVGKTTLLRSIFALDGQVTGEASSGDVPDQLTTSATSAETRDFNSFTIRNEEGFKIQFTDGPGLGESIQKDERYIGAWIEEIPNHDILYWVIDASSRDIAHIQRNMKKILDETGYRDRIVVVLNKVDQIELEREDREEGEAVWDEDFNVPTDALEHQIERRTDDIIDKLADYADISEDQIVICSALKRWNHGEVLDKLLEYLPEQKRIKASRNRDVKSFVELMSDEAKAEIREDVEEVSVEESDGR